MAKISVPLLVPKPSRTLGGPTLYYWQPSATLKRAGWKSLPLGSDRGKAIAAAEARNDEVARVHTGGGQAAVPRLAARATVDELIAGFRTEHMPSLAPNTRHTYSAALNIVSHWAGDQHVHVLDADLVAAFRDAMMAPHPETGIVRHYRAHNTLRVLRTLLEFAIAKKILPRHGNPAEKFDLATPDPRHQVWLEEDDAAFDRGAAAIGYPSLGFARELTEWLGQREADMIALNSSHWREISALELGDPQLHQALAEHEPDGRVMGFQILQAKGSRKNRNAPLRRRWVGVPVVGALRRKVEAAIAANSRQDVAVTTILANDHNRQPWTTRRFQFKFAQARDWAIAPPPKVDPRSPVAAGADVAPHPAMADLQFRDLRRTAVVRLGNIGLDLPAICAITGHTLKSAQTILETYMPRNVQMAARGVVARLEHERKRQDERKRA